MLLLFPMLLATGASAQGRTFVIDRSNGPGTHFLDLPPALTQAQDGDKFLIRAGFYSAGSTDKGVALLGGPGVTIAAPNTGYAASLTVENLAPGAVFVARDLSLGAGNVMALSLQNNSGRVHLSELHASVGGGLWPSVMLTNCLAVTIQQATLAGWILCTQSALVLDHVSAVGLPTHSASIFTSPALSANTCHVSLVDCTLTGSNAARGMSGTSRAMPGMISLTSDVTITASAAGGSRLVAGQGAILPSTYSSALLVQGGTAIIDPRVQLVPSGSEPPIVGSGTMTITPFPTLGSVGGAVGGTITTTLTHTPGQPYAVALAHVADPIPLFSGMLFIDGGAHVVFASGTIPPAGQLVWSLPVPNDSFLRGRVFVFQGVTLALPVNALVLTNPAFVTMH